MSDDKKLTVLLCDCEKTMSLDGPALGKALHGVCDTKTCSNLCRSEIGTVIEAARDAERGLIIGCTQESLTFTEQLEAAGLEIAPRLLNVRERAGWSAEGKEAGAKIAALVEEATLDLPDVPTVAYRSAGVCLVYGPGQIALEAARQLSARLPVSLLLTEVGETLPLGATDLMISKGSIAKAAGHLGNFEVFVDGFAALRPSSRASLDFELARDGAASRCDILIDLSGGAALFSAHERRDGYLRADPGDPAAIQRALFEAVDLVGEFEKPRYVQFREELCAHSRNRITGCTRCLDLCPVSAIQPAGDHVAIDPYICGGCGACHSVCPTGAASYAYPRGEDLLRRLATLLSRYRESGGQRAVVLFHDQAHGWPIIEATARFGEGLPARVLPVEVNEVTQLSVDVMLSALVFGAERLVILGTPAKQQDFAGLAGEIGICETIMSGLGYESGLVELVVEDDPDRVSEALRNQRTIAERSHGIFVPQADKRANLRLATAHLHERAPAPVDSLPLPPGAAYGTVNVETTGCTLCLACVSTCPTGALGDNPELPQLSFQEEACIQCGLCRNTCPESVITLEPRFAFTKQAKERAVLYEEEPFCCVSCGKPFASKSTIEKMLSALAGKHSMFQGSAAETLKMCEDCRVIAHFEAKEPQMASGERPLPRTTEDYLAGRTNGEADEDEEK